jgi:hypothetical protein
MCKHTEAAMLVDLANQLYTDIATDLPGTSLKRTNQCVDTNSGPGKNYRSRPYLPIFRLSAKIALQTNLQNRLAVAGTVNRWSLLKCEFENY